MQLDQVRRDYVKVYGEGSPCCFLYRTFPPKNFLGVENNGDEILFRFVDLDDDAFYILETQFRNRLSRKISFSVGETFFTINLSSFAEEEQDEVKCAIEDLNRFFSGQEMSPRLKAEVSLHCKKLDWRDEKLVAQEML